MREVRVRRHAGEWSAALLEDENIAGAQTQASGLVVLESRAGGTPREAALSIAPRVEGHFIVLRGEPGIVERLEDLGPVETKQLWQRGLGHGWRLDAASEETRLQRGRTGGVSAGENETGRGRGGRIEENLDPGAGVAAIVHEIVNESSVTPHRNAGAAGPEIRLRGESILAVAQSVGDVGE